MTKIRNIKLFVNDNIKSMKVAKQVEERLIEKGFNISDDEFDLGIAIGGDGSFLRMVKQSCFNSEVLYVGVNAGTLGFAQEINADEIDSFINDINDNNYEYEEVGVGEAEITTADSVSKFYYLNEITLRDKELNTTGLDVLVDGSLLEEYVGDGLLISTSFGSTAYNLSFGGSIVYNTFHTLQITPIAPLNNKSYRNLINSVIIPSEKVITIIPNRSKDLLVTVDGDNNVYDDVEKTNISIRDKKIKIIRKSNYNFIEKVNDKFLK